MNVNAYDSRTQTGLPGGLGRKKAKRIIIDIVNLAPRVFADGLSCNEHQSGGEKAAIKEKCSLDAINDVTVL